MNPIQLSEPQAGWAAEFEAIARDLRAHLSRPEEPVTRIDHIGSTAVVGLAAKDVIDIQLTVTKLSNRSAIGPLTKRGYQLRDDIRFDNLVGMPDNDPQLAKHYLTQPPGQRAVHVHVREQGRINQEYPLLFRDFLRADANVRQAYERIKRELAQRFPNDSSAYYAIKDPYMDTIYAAACLWRDATGWQQDQHSL